MFCAQCGTNNAEGTAFCSRCGAGLAAGASGPAGPAADAAPPYAAVARTSGKAIASLVCGIFFLFFPVAVAAIILGHLSLVDIRKSAGRLTGKGLATAGLVLGYAGVAFIPFILIIAAIAIPNLLRARMAANEASAVGSLRTINTAEETYKSQYQNGYARSLDMLGGGSADSANCDHAQLIDNALAHGRRTGYYFSYVPLADENAVADASVVPTPSPGCSWKGSARYQVTAVPAVRDQTGTRSFYTDQTGVIRSEAEGTAGPDSPPLE